MQHNTNKYVDNQNTIVISLSEERGGRRRKKGKAAGSVKMISGRYKPPERKTRVRRVQQGGPRIIWILGLGRIQDNGGIA